MKPKVYIETSVISYYTGKQSSDLVIAGRQQLTREWWEESRRQFAKILRQKKEIVTIHSFPFHRKSFPK